MWEKFESNVPVWQHFQNSIFRINDMVSLFGDMKVTLGPSDYFLPLIMTEIFDIRNFLSSDILFL